MEQLHLVALNKDIRKQGYGMLPDDCSSKTNFKLQGNVIVQVGQVCCLLAQLCSCAGASHKHKQF